MRAVIMAGGEGSRLRPITCDTPKPLVRLCGRPVMEYILDLLIEHGFHEISVSAGYLAGELTSRFAEGYRERPLAFVIEELPLGTAGGVKNACPPGEGPILVISGDAVCNFDLTGALRFHEKTGAKATLVVKRVEDPREYGVIKTDGAGRITGFLEKPSFSQASSRLANTGVYLLSPEVLSYLRMGERCDFAQDLFPEMLERGEKLYAYEEEGYWCDVGDVGALMGCQRALLSGEAGIALLGNRDEIGNLYEDTPPQGRYTVIYPSFIGKGVRIAEDAVIDRSVVEAGCEVGPGAFLSECLVGRNAVVSGGARITGAFVCPAAQIGPGAELLFGAVVGSSCIVSAGARVCEEVRVWPHLKTKKGEILRHHLRERGRPTSLFEDEGVNLSPAQEPSALFAARLACAAVSSGFGRLCVGGEDSPRNRGVISAMLAGAALSGASCLPVLTGRKPLFFHVLRESGADVGVWVKGDRAELYDRTCLPLTRMEERKIEAVVSRSEYRWGGAPGEILDVQRWRESYLAAARDAIGEKKLPFWSKTAPFALRKFLSQRSDPDCVGEAFFSPDGARVSLRVKGEKVPWERLVLLAAADEFLSGRDVALPDTLLPGIDGFAKEQGRAVLRYALCPAGREDEAARALAAGETWLRDGLLLLAKARRRRTEAGKEFESLLRKLPRLFQFQRNVALSENPLAVLERLPGEHTQNGVALSLPGGVVLARSSKSGDGVRLYSEAGSEKTALELCSFVAGLLQPPGSKGPI